MGDYTLILSRGTHGLSEAEADRVTVAIVEHQPFIDIKLDYFGDGLSLRVARVITSHIIMIIENVEESTHENELSGLLSGRISSIRDHFSSR